jgi:hypothetical protein
VAASLVEVGEREQEQVGAAGALDGAISRLLHQLVGGGGELPAAADRIPGQHRLDPTLVGAAGRADRLDLILMYGNMSLQMRQILLQALQQIPDPVDRVRMAVHLISISPEYAVLK